MTSTAKAPNRDLPSLREQVRNAVIWRSGTQIFGQLITWASTFLVIRILSPSDYGIYSMTSVLLVLLALMNGYGLSNALIQRREVTTHMLRQLFGMQVVLNVTLAAIQMVVAPYVAAFYHQPMVTKLLRVQALIYLTNPFLAIGYAVLSRAMDFRKQAQVNLVSSLLAAATALGGALAGLGVWTLVCAPLVGFATRAFGTAWAARINFLPSFDFTGAWPLARYGGIVAIGEFFWFVQTQADVVIAGRTYDAHLLGIYTTSIFLTQMFINKFVPPINEVAFSAYARVQEDRQALAAGFLKAVRLIMLIGIPVFLGLAAASQTVVAVVLGEKWRETAPVIAILGFAMPVMCLHVLFGPAVNAAGRPGIETRSSALGAVLLPICFLVGVRWGVTGMAAAWLVGYPLLTGVASCWVLPVLGTTHAALLRTLAAPVLSGLFMFAVVRGVDMFRPFEAVPLLHLAVLVAAGGTAYLGALLLFARQQVMEVLDLARRRT